MHTTVTVCAHYWLRVALHPHSLAPHSAFAKASLHRQMNAQAHRTQSRPWPIRRCACHYSWMLANVHALPESSNLIHSRPQQSILPHPPFCCLVMTATQRLHHAPVLQIQPYTRKQKLKTEEEKEHGGEEENAKKKKKQPVCAFGGHRLPNAVLDASCLLAYPAFSAPDKLPNTKPTPSHSPSLSRLQHLNIAFLL